MTQRLLSKYSFQRRGAAPEVERLFWGGVFTKKILLEKRFSSQLDVGRSLNYIKTNEIQCILMQTLSLCRFYKHFTIPVTYFAIEIILDPGVERLFWGGFILARSGLILGEGQAAMQNIQQWFLSTDSS